MKLTARQTRQLLLAGTIAFPKPFPTIGKVSIERSRLVYSRNATKGTTFVVVQERRKDAVTRLILRTGVAAIFFPGTWVRGPKKKRFFRFSRRRAVHNLTRGEWFLGPEIDVDTIRKRLYLPKLRIDKRINMARGIVFVHPHQPVVTITEKVQLAGCIDPYGLEQHCCDPDYGCDCDYGCPPGCDPDHVRYRPESGCDCDC